MQIRVQIDFVFIAHGNKHLDSRVGIINAQHVDIQRKKPATVVVTGFIFWRRRRDSNSPNISTSTLVLHTFFFIVCNFVCKSQQKTPLAASDGVEGSRFICCTKFVFGVN